MVKTFLAVIQDLSQFVFESIAKSGSRAKVTTHSLHPRFEPRKQYYASNPETLKLRLKLSAYNQTKLEKPLSALEFILYRLNDLHLYRPDGTVPELTGFFHETFKKNPQVHVGIKPVRHSVMEIFDTDQTPKLLFVENVFGDDSIEVESVGLYVLGEFRYDVFTKTEWQEWRPVFITFNSPI